MAGVKDPDYVTGKPGAYEVQPPIEHPPFCVCKHCKKVRTTEEAWACTMVYRTVRRKSPNPTSRTKSAAFALRVKEEVQRKLIEDVRLRALAQLAHPNAITFGFIADAYRAYQAENGKRLDRAKYVIRTIEEFFDRERDPKLITKADYRTFKTYLSGEREVSASTINRYSNVLLAILNFAVKEDYIDRHQLVNLPKKKVEPTDTPKTLSIEQVDALLGAGMDDFEAEQAGALASYDADTHHVPPSAVPLRGICLLAYLTLMRPDNNFGLRWEQLTIDWKKNAGMFRLTRHKNAPKIGSVEGPLQPILVAYLKTIYPGPGAKGLVHPNPATGLPYRNIRMQWFRLIELANKHLPAGQQIDAHERFYCWRHTGASSLAASSGDPVMVTKMMGDSSLATVMRHYFNSSTDHMQAAVAKWEPVTTGAPLMRGGMRGNPRRGA
jgi:integrase